MNEKVTWKKVIIAIILCYVALAGIVVAEITK